MSEQGSNLPPGEMTAHGGVAYGFTPYDLEAPARVLMPTYHHLGQSHDTRVLILGHGDEDEAARFTRHDWGACGHGCHDAEAYVVLSVPCDAMPHCGTCECGDGHERILSDEEVRRLKELLP